MKEVTPPSWIDLDALYTRQDIVSLTGIDDEVLGYWIKRGLLKHSEGGEGKGVHRRYQYAQVNIAVILAVFRNQFGANIATLSSLAEAFQDGVRAFSGTRVKAKDWWKVSGLARELHAFRAGKEVLIDAHHWSDPDFESIPQDEWLLKRPAVSEAEIIARELAEIESHPNAAIKLAERLGPNGGTQAAIARALLGTMIDPRYYSDVQWLVRQSGNAWTILEAFDGEFARGVLTDPGIFVPVTLLIRRTWKIPSGGLLASYDKLKRFNMALRDSGVPATVSHAEEGGFNAYIVEPQSEAPAATRIGQMLGLGKPQDQDRAFSRRYEDVYWTPEDHAAEIQRLRDEIIDLDKQELVRGNEP